MTTELTKLGRPRKRKPFGFFDPTQQRLRQLFHIDAGTGLFTRLVSTGGRARAGTDTFGHLRHGRHVIRVDGRHHACSRLVYIYFHGAIPPGMQIDHERRNPETDALSELRMCSAQNNVRNRGKRADNSSSLIGISWFPPNQKYRAYCTDDVGTKRHLGYFDDPIEAARVRDAFARKHHGEFAELNFDVEKTIEKILSSTI